MMPKNFIQNYIADLSNFCPNPVCKSAASASKAPSIRNKKIIARNYVNAHIILNAEFYFAFLHKVRPKA
jgi:hypothetical protein